MTQYFVPQGQTLITGIPGQAGRLALPGLREQEALLVRLVRPALLAPQGPKVPRATPATPALLALQVLLVPQGPLAPQALQARLALACLQAGPRASSHGSPRPRTTPRRGTR